MSAKSTVNIELNEELFEQLQSLAIPLVDDLNTVISRLIEHWENNPPTETTGHKPKNSWWLTPRGEKLPINTEIRARYNGEEFKGKILKTGIFFEGETFTSLSAAGIAAKKKNFNELSDASASTNGWRFWEYFDKETKRWRSISNFRDSM